MRHSFLKAVPGLLLLISAAVAQDSAQGTADSAATNANLGLGGIQRGVYRPQTPKERWELWGNTSFVTPGAYLRAFAPAITDQATGTPPGFPNGAAGYGARVGSRFGRFTMAGGIQSAMGQALGHDSRYIASSDTSARARFRQAFLYSFLTYNREGKPVLDISSLTGSFVSEAAFAHWSGQRWDVKGYQGLIQQVALGWTINLAREYWPEIQRLLKKKKRDASTTTSSPAAVPQTSGSSTPANRQP